LLFLKISLVSSIHWYFENFIDILKICPYQLFVSCSSVSTIKFLILFHFLFLKLLFTFFWHILWFQSFSAFSRSHNHWNPCVMCHPCVTIFSFSLFLITIYNTLFMIRFTFFHQQVFCQKVLRKFMPSDFLYHIWLLAYHLFIGLPKLL